MCQFEVRVIDRGWILFVDEGGQQGSKTPIALVVETRGLAVDNYGARAEEINVIKSGGAVNDAVKIFLEVASAWKFFESGKAIHKPLECCHRDAPIFFGSDRGQGGSIRSADIKIDECPFPHVRQRRGDKTVALAGADLLAGDGELFGYREIEADVMPGLSSWEKLNGLYSPSHPGLMA